MRYLLKRLLFLVLIFYAQSVNATVDETHNKAQVWDSFFEEFLLRNHSTRRVSDLEKFIRTMKVLNFYQVPIEVSKHRQFFLASKWIINAARGHSGKSMSDRLASELISAANGEGGAIKKKEDTHRMAEANRAFAHFR